MPGGARSARLAPRTSRAGRLRDSEAAVRSGGFQGAVGTERHRHQRDERQRSFEEEIRKGEGIVLIQNRECQRHGCMVAQQLDWPGGIPLVQLAEVQGRDGEDRQGGHPQRSPRAGLPSRDDGERNDQGGESKREQAQARWCRDCRLLDRGYDLNDRRTRAETVADEYWTSCGRTDAGQPRVAPNAPRPREEAKRPERERLRQPWQGRYTEIAKTAADEGLDVPDQAQNGGQQKQAVDPRPGLWLVLLGRSTIASSMRTAWFPRRSL